MGVLNENPKREDYYSGTEACHGYDGQMHPEILNRITLFRGLSPEDLSAFGRLLHRQRFLADSTIMTVQQVGEVVYVILDGTVKIQVGHEHGSDVLISILGPGDIVGEMSVLDNTRRCASVVTLEVSTLLWIDRAAFRRCLGTMPVLTHNLACILAARLRLANEHIRALATCEVEGRVARQLLAFAGRYGRETPDGGVHIPIRLKQGDIASIVGASRESVNKIMVSYKERKFISVDLDHRITVHNKEALAKRSR
jgi:CRP/FNR family transcriptional regulator, cyclic AMP receptor protein